MAEVHGYHAQIYYGDDSRLPVAVQVCGFCRTGALTELTMPRRVDQSRNEQVPGIRSTLYRAKRTISAHKLLLAVAVVLAIAVTVGAVLRGDPGPCLGTCDDQPAAWFDSQAQATPVARHAP